MLNLVVRKETARLQKVKELILFCNAFFTLYSMLMWHPYIYYLSAAWFGFGGQS